MAGFFYRTLKTALHRWHALADIKASLCRRQYSWLHGHHCFSGQLIIFLALIVDKTLAQCLQIYVLVQRVKDDQLTAAPDHAIVRIHSEAVRQANLIPT